MDARTCAAPCGALAVLLLKFRGTLVNTKHTRHRGALRLEWLPKHQQLFEVGRNQPYNLILMVVSDVDFNFMFWLVMNAICLS